MAYPTRVCAQPGPAYVLRDGTWMPTRLERVACGAVVRVTTLKADDARLSSDVVIMRVRGVEFAVPTKSVALQRKMRKGR